MITSVIGSLIALGLAATTYTEPERGRSEPEPLRKVLAGYGTALKNARFAMALVVFAGFYFMAEQFYMTFPKYVTRHIDKNAPLEIITLINPALIALFQGAVLRATAKLHPLTGMICGMLLGSLSMLVMGVVPGLIGACASGALFAFCEMCFSPRFYDYLASFAPSGKAGMYMGLAFVPFAIGAWVGGQASGRLIAAYLPEVGDRHPLTVWSLYAALGLVFALAMTAYRSFALRSDPQRASD
jgi:hypothetical protein